MTREKTWPFFLIALFFSLVSFLPVSPFSPYLALVYRRGSWAQSLWIAAICGFFLDLLGERVFGLHVVQMVVITFFLYRLRTYFFDRPSGLASYTTIISLFSTLFSYLALSFTSSCMPLTARGFLTDCAIMPLLDASYSLLFFSFPLTLYRFLKKGYFHFLFLRKQSNKKREKHS